MIKLLGVHVNVFNKSLYLTTGRVVITVLPPISTEGLTSADIPQLMEETRAAMIETFHRQTHKLLAEVNFASYKVD